MESRTPSAPVFKTRLQRILEEEGRRQTWLARQVNVNPSRINLIANGLHVDDDDLKARIARALRRTVVDVFDTPIDAPIDNDLSAAA